MRDCASRAHGNPDTRKKPPPQLPMRGSPLACNPWAGVSLWHACSPSRVLSYPRRVQFHHERAEASRLRSRLLAARSTFLR
eukprot:scaffold261439_cov27-Tisochrysis_lutea.AAC.2